jgi:60 kDa SS-A/Ro ribonucleoprotein
MTASLLRHTPRRQSQAEMRGLVQNNAGGDSYTVDLWQRFMRFLIIGTDSGTYYVNEKDHTLDNIQVVKDALKADYVRAIHMITEVSTAGRAPKNDYAIYALAVAAASPNKNCAGYALAQLSKVLRIGTHLFQFVAFVDTMRGWGPALRKAVSNWYLDRTPDQLAYQVLKYQGREGWKHRDVLRKAHPQTNQTVMNNVLRYAAEKPVDAHRGDVPPIFLAFNEAKQTTSAERITELIEDYGLSREMLPTEWLLNKYVLRALAEKSPYTALIRNLGNLTRHGVLEDENTKSKIIEQITNPTKIAKSRVHPLTILTAHRTYGQGTGFRSNKEWTTDRQVLNALELAFYEAFDYVEPTGKRFLIGLDISGSMASKWGDGILSAAEIAAAIGMVTLRTEPWTKIMGFSGQFINLGIDPNDTLEQVLVKTSRHNFGSTDCSLPMQYALQNNLAVDTFIVITDGETWAGRSTPADALRAYRKFSGIDAKLIVLATESTGFSIADPNDKGMLDIAGFDSSVPEVIRAFTLGEI